MAKGYWVVVYRSVKNPDGIAAYAKLAGPAVAAGGGRKLVRGEPTQVHEAGLKQRVVVIEFDSVAQAIATHDSAAYKEALRVLGDSVERDLRIVEGLG